MNTLDTALIAAVPVASHGAGRRAWRRLAANRLALVGLVIILAAVAASLAAPWLAPYDPNAATPMLRNAGLGTQGHWLGLDAQGRDILSRLVWGGRPALLSSIVPVAISVLLALACGLLAGYYRNRWSALIMRVIDVLFAFPMVLLAIGLATALGPGGWAVGLTIIFSATPYLTRVVYAGVRAERDKDYVEAARAGGATPADLLLREILPNVVSAAVVYGTTLVGGMIVFQAGLSFLGLGTQPPHADWGRMVAEGAQVLVLGAAHVATLPALVIVAVALSFNWLGNGLRDVLDPRD
ncbi:ABC transporter permease [Bordetella genomosp. 5]|uniref:ABC transporter permease n=1 Tax=Bordetella genomosp. 5 TaxID=1395608 RepID=A0A261TT95_9BORD|nr:ABC transporter permease [Bordetella genomosp. 5]OZI51853.1 ABC transporter permease [Bordetella genomosp. 5]